ncbi:MAG: efflux RND transporter periplasmic adaptor subunit [Bacteroides sp.]|nr:efflux RND transporter periplasmic adaptor subunit [Bacteroides sp.]
MKKIIFMGAIGLFLLGSCTGKTAHNHEAHNHETEEHSHEGHEHSHEGHTHEHGEACTHDHEHEGHNHEGHDHDAHSHEGHTHAEEAHNHDAHDHDAHAGHNHGEEAHGSDEIVLPVAKAKAAGVKVSTVQPTVFHQVIKTSGQVMAAQGDESMAVATVSGVVSFRGKVVEGMSVSKGTPVIMLSSQNMAEGDPVQKARIAYETAQKEYERMKALVASKIVSQKEFIRAEEAYENARISYEAVAKNHSNNGQSVTAPIAGYIKTLLVKEGDYVNVGQPLFSVTQNRKLFLKADVSEKYYAYLHTIGSANFCTPYNNKVYQLKELNGRLLSYGKSAGSNGFYVPVTFEFDNKGEVIPGSYVEVYLLSTPLNDVIALPRTAITEEQGSFFVYQQLDAECYKKQLVTLGADNGASVQILSGVHAGDKIVTQGAYQVKLASATNAIPAHSHEH